jgi:hypothetical protein
MSHFSLGHRMHAERMANAQASLRDHILRGWLGPKLAQRLSGPADAGLLAQRIFSKRQRLDDPIRPQCSQQLYLNFLILCSY